MVVNYRKVDNNTMQRPVAALFLMLTAYAQSPLPELRTEPTDGGSVFRIRNTSSQPLTAYLIELIDYPGSYYALWQDEIASPIPPGGEKRIPVTNMTVGAVPDYVKLQAALYADGSSSGVPEKVVQFIERRKFTLETTRQLIGRIEKGASIAELKQWAESFPPPTRSNRTSQTTVNNTAARALILDTAGKLENQTPANVLSALRISESALATSKPTL